MKRFITWFVNCPAAEEIFGRALVVIGALTGMICGAILAAFATDSVLVLLPLCFGTGFGAVVGLFIAGMIVDVMEGLVDKWEREEEAIRAAQYAAFDASGRERW